MLKLGSANHVSLSLHARMRILELTTATSEHPRPVYEAYDEEGEVGEDNDEDEDQVEDEDDKVGEGKGEGDGDGEGGGEGEDDGESEGVQKGEDGGKGDALDGEEKLGGKDEEETGLTANLARISSVRGRGGSRIRPSCTKRVQT